MISVVIADDQALVRGGLRMIVEAQPDMQVLGEAEDGGEAVELVRRVDPDVALIDVRMPKVDGIEATRRMGDGATRTRILILTTFDSDEYLYETMKAGASGFLLKSAPPAQLTQAIRTVAAGDALLAPSITRRLVEQFVRRPAPGSKRPTRLAELTDRELEVLGLIARGQSNAEIAQTLVVSEATVKTHVNHLLSKLSLRDRVQAVVLAYETGLVQPGSAGHR